MIGEAPIAGRREWMGLAVIALPCLLYSMDLTVLELAVPKLSADLKPSSSQLLWIMDVYGFLLAGFLLTMGTLGDRIGRRRLLLIGAAAFGVASVLAAFSTSAEMLIATRALLGVAGATLAPSTLSLIRNMFVNTEQRAFAIGVWATSFAVGTAIGPLAGGFLSEFFWWGSVFLLAVPVMLLLLVLGPVLLPEYRDPGAGRLDLISAAISLVAVVLMIYGLKQIVQDGVVTCSHYRGGARSRRPVRAQTAQAGRPFDRPPALRGTGVRHLAFRVPAQHLRDSRYLLLRRPVPPTRTPALAASGWSLDVAVGGWARSWLHARPTGGAPGPPGLRDGRRPDALGGRFRDAHPGRDGLRAGDARGWLRSLLPGRRPGRNSRSPTCSRDDCWAMDNSR